MEPLYQLCAVVGGTIFVGQFVLSFIGLAGHDDFSGDAGGDHFDGGDHVDSADHAGGDGHHGSGALGHDAATWWFVGLLSFRTVVAGLTFFGLSGLAAGASGVGAAGTLAIAALSGLAALYLVAWMMRSMMRLRADGTVRIENTVGQTALVYLTIPGHRAGKGKVTVTVQNRTMEYEAETEYDALPTASRVQIVAVVGGDSLAVVPFHETARTNHAQ